MIVYQVVNEYKKLDEVVAITIAGSGASGKNDFFYDIDIDIILKSDIERDKRKTILQKLSDSIETIQGKFGEKDIFILRNSTIQIAIAYFTLDTLKENLTNVVERYEASKGYTTCLWKNVINSYIAYDRDNIFRDIQNKYRVKYPDELKANIIGKNYSLLRDGISSYYNQINRAINRGDAVSINHKISKFLDSYFDIIFALNEMPHPGGKRILPIINAKCSKKPKHINEGVKNLLESAVACDESILKNIDYIVDELKELLEEENVI